VNVSDILDVMASFSIGSTHVTPQQRSLHLKYLNVAYEELYRETALVNEGVSSLFVFKDAYEGHNGITLNEDAMMVSSVFDFSNRQELAKQTTANALKAYEGCSGHLHAFSAVLDAFVPQFQVFLYPAPVKAHVLITWIKNIIPLQEITKSSELPYPADFHSILVDGGLWYVFQEEGGFKDSLKAKESKRRWEKGKQNLTAFLFNSYETQSREAMNV
jgi:hypothetical protein